MYFPNIFNQYYCLSSFFSIVSFVLFLFLCLFKGFTVTRCRINWAELSSHTYDLHISHAATLYCKINEQVMWTKKNI